MLTNYFALFDCQSSTFFSDQKCVCNFPWKTIHRRSFIFKPCVTHFNDATYSKACTTVKRLAKRVDEYFK